VSFLVKVLVVRRNVARGERLTPIDNSGQLLVIVRNCLCLDLRVCVCVCVSRVEPILTVAVSKQMFFAAVDISR